MLIIFIILGIVLFFITLFLYCSLVLASRCDEEMEYPKN